MDFNNQQDNISYSYPVQQPPKRPKKKYGLGALLTVAIVCALICGIISSGCVMLVMEARLKDKLSQALETSSKSSAPVQNITITDTTSDVATAVAAKVAASVVGIRVNFTTQSYYFFFPSSISSSAEGSGVIYSEDGYIITNYHVISEAVESASYGSVASGASIEVYLPSDPETAINASVVGYDSSCDLAVIKIDKTGLPTIEIGDSDSLTVGQTAIAIGNPGGLEFMGSVSSGIISGLNRSIATENGTQMHLVQTDAAINPGNSGGALVNSEGKLIGINNSKMSGTDFEGMGFAIPVNEVVEISDRIISRESNPQAYLGVTINTNYSSAMLSRMGYPEGVVVYSVDEDSPAQRAGIKPGDIITKINDTAITSYAAMISEKNKYDAGDAINITVYRNGSTATVSVVLE